VLLQKLGGQRRLTRGEIEGIAIEDLEQDLGVVLVIDAQVQRRLGSTLNPPEELETVDDEVAEARGQRPRASRVRA
jgi:hypothetical protein